MGCTWPIENRSAVARAVDYIVVGQGLAGSALAFELLRRGKRVHVFDEPEMNRASVISAGICNPVTGKVMKPTYAADLLFPFLHRWYPEAERTLHTKFFFPLPMYRPFLSREEQVAWKNKVSDPELQRFVRQVHESPQAGESLNDPYGGLELSQSGYLDVHAWVKSVRERLIQEGAYEQRHVDERELVVDQTVSYQGLTATRVIFCQGVAANKSGWFGYLPIRPLKGETLGVRMGLSSDRMISRGAYVVPGRHPGEFVVGSTYQHEPFPSGNSEDGKRLLLERLARLVRVAVEPLHQDWGIRPTVSDRRPLLGAHPATDKVVIFNGLGTKGVSLAPYFASRLADWMDGAGTLPNEVNISRFKPLYSN